MNVIKKFKEWAKKHVWAIVGGIAGLIVAIFLLHRNSSGASGAMIQPSNSGSGDTSTGDTSTPSGGGGGTSSDTSWLKDWASGMTSVISGLASTVTSWGGQFAAPSAPAPSAPAPSAMSTMSVATPDTSGVFAPVAYPTSAPASHPQTPWQKDLAATPSSSVPVTWVSTITGKTVTKDTGNTGTNVLAQGLINLFGSMANQQKAAGAVAAPIHAPVATTPSASSLIDKAKAAVMNAQTSYNGASSKASAQVHHDQAQNTRTSLASSLQHDTSVATSWVRNSAGYQNLVVTDKKTGKKTVL